MEYRKYLVQETARVHEFFLGMFHCYDDYYLIPRHGTYTFLNYNGNRCNTTRDYHEVVRDMLGCGVSLKLKPRYCDDVRFAN